MTSYQELTIGTKEKRGSESNDDGDFEMTCSKHVRKKVRGTTKEDYPKKSKVKK